MPGPAHSPRSSDISPQRREQNQRRGQNPRREQNQRRERNPRREQYQGRKQVRGARVTAAVSLLLLATALVVGSLALREPLLIGAAGGVALVTGWIALRLAWNELVLTRYEHAIDRTEVARAYRELFETGAADHTAFAGAMESRMAEREHRVTELRAVLSRVEERAAEAEASARESQARLDQAEAQIENEVKDRVALRRQARRASASPSGSRSGASARRSTPTPERAFLEPDQLSSLLAREEHARRVAQDIAQGVPGRTEQDQGRHAG